MARQDDNQYLWKEDRWNGGLSEDSKTAVKGSARYLSGADIQSDTGFLSILHKPTRDDASITIDADVNWIDINPLTGDVFYYGGTKIWKESAGTYSLIKTLSGDSPAGQGMGHFNGALYVMKDTILSKFDYSTWTDSLQTGFTSSPWHPFCRFRNVTLIGHGRYVATIDDVGTITMQRITLPPNYHVRHMFKVGKFVAILATYGTTITGSDEGFMFLWNGTSETYNDPIPLNGNPHGGASMDNEIVIFAGNSPRINLSQGGVSVTVMGIPNVGDGKTLEINPGAIDVFDKMVHFGISGGNSTTAWRGVYTWGAKNSLLEDALNAAYPMSTGTITGTGAKITAVRKVGTTVRFAWTDGSTRGIDEVDMTKYQTTATRRSLAFDRNSPYEKVAMKIKVELAGVLQEGEGIAVKLSDDPYDDPTFSDANNYVSGSQTTEGEKILELPFNQEDVQIRGGDLHYELILTAGTSGNTAPKVKRAWIAFQEEADQI